MSLYDTLNKVSSLATRAELEPEVRMANQEFFALTGAVSEEDRSFEARMGLFLEWYMFDRPLSTHGMTPVEYFLRNPSPELTTDDLAILPNFMQIKHSIFEFVRAKDNLVTVNNLATAKKQKVYERRGTAGLFKGDIFEARLIPHDDQLHFSGPMLFHPKGAKKYIKKLFKEEKDQPKAAIMKLSAMGLKIERYRHVPLEKIYNQAF